MSIGEIRGLIAMVDLSEQRLWMFSTEEIAKLAQQQSSGRHHLYMWTDPTVVTKGSEKR